MSDADERTRRLTYEKLAETEIEQYPVIHAEFRDTRSYANVVLDRENDLLRVTHVASRAHGDMRRILDDMTDQLDCRHVRFMVPLNDALEQRVSGFERREETVAGPDGPETVEILDGEWERDDTLDADDED